MLPVEHVHVGVLPAQIEPGPHLVPHEPQLLGSVFATQTLEQIMSPVGQVHVPLWQILPPVQACPQPPQLFASVLVFTQTPLQNIPPDGHPQMPFVQS